MSFDIEGLDKLQEGLKQVVQTGVNEINKGLDRINNPESANAKSTSGVPAVCPYCGAKLNTNTEDAEIVCEYCGTKFDNSNARSIVDSVFDFVEKQQKIAADEKARQAEIAREKAAKKVVKKKKSRIGKFFFLRVVVMILMYYYMHFI